MTKRWMKAVNDGTDALDLDLPWARGARRSKRKAAARARALAA